MPKPRKIELIKKGELYHLYINDVYYVDFTEEELHQLAAQYHAYVELKLKPFEEYLCDSSSTQSRVQFIKADITPA